MREFRLKEGEEFIRLGQLLKAANMVSSGVEAKIEIQNGSAEVNSEVCTMRGKKLRVGDLVLFRGETIRIVEQYGSS